MRLRPSPVLAALAAALVLFAILATACVKRETAEVNRPIADNLASYWTCAVFFVTDGRQDNANEAFELVPWFETRLRERGVFEPLGRDEQHEAEVTLRLTATTGKGRVTLRMQLFDTKTNDTLGDLESLASVEEDADGGEFPEPPRVVALHKAADELLKLLAEKRHESNAKPHPKSPPAPLPEPPAVGPSAVCTTQCQPTAASSSSFDEQHRVGLGMNDTMKALRGCLDRVGAQLVEPAVLLRFSPDGQLRHMRVDVGGWETNECIRNVRTRIPSSVRASRASILRCEYHCTTS